MALMSVRRHAVGVLEGQVVLLDGDGAGGAEGHAAMAGRALAVVGDAAASPPRPRCRRSSRTAGRSARTGWQASLSMTTRNSAGMKVVEAITPPPTVPRAPGGAPLPGALIGPAAMAFCRPFSADPRHHRLAGQRHPALLRMRADLADGRLLAGHVDHVAVAGRDQRPQLDAVVEGHHAVVHAQHDGERAVEQGRAVDHAQSGEQLALLFGHQVDVFPEGAGQSLARYLHGQPVPPEHEVEQVGDHLGVGLQRALVAEHLQVAPVDAVGADLAVVHDGVVEQGEGMRAAPPARGVGGEAAVAGPGPALVLVDAEELAYLLGEADALERAHVLARRGDEGAVDVGVDVHDRVDHVVLGAQLGLVRAAPR